MARRSRQDSPGSWHHVVNRGIAKRALFETRADARYFLSCLARQVRAGRIEVHAYCLMTNHFHLLLRSPVGELSEAMRKAQNGYSRYFNRRRKRDGPLIRGRFFSKPVHSDHYRALLVRYIDANPVQAGIVKASYDYELGSASDYQSRSGPLWLYRSWVEQQVSARAASGVFSAKAYAEHFGLRAATELSDLEELIEARLASPAEADPFDDLVGAAPPRVQAWMQRKAKLADGHRVGLPVCTRQAVRGALERSIERAGAWMVEDGSRTRRGREIAEPGLLRDLCGLSWRGIAKLGDGSTPRARRLGGVHQRLMLEDLEYAGRVSLIASDAIAVSMG